MAIPWLPWNKCGTPENGVEISQNEKAPDRRENPAQGVAKCEGEGESPKGGRKAGEGLGSEGARGSKGARGEQIEGGAVKTARNKP